MCQSTGERWADERKSSEQHQKSCFFSCCWICRQRTGDRGAGKQGQKKKSKDGRLVVKGGSEDRMLLLPEGVVCYEPWWYSGARSRRPCYINQVGHMLGGGDGTSIRGLLRAPNELVIVVANHGAESKCTVCTSSKELKETDADRISVLPTAVTNSTGDAVHPALRGSLSKTNRSDIMGLHHGPGSFCSLQRPEHLAYPRSCRKKLLHITVGLHQALSGLSALVVFVFVFNE